MKTKPIRPISRIKLDSLNNESEFSLLKKLFNSNFDYFLLAFMAIFIVLIFLLIIKQLL